MLSKSYTSVLEVRRERKVEMTGESERVSERKEEREREKGKRERERKESWKGKEILQRVNLKTH